MGKWKDTKGKVRQKSICFKELQMRIIEDHHEFNPHKFCQDAIEEQIKLHPDANKYLSQ